jgi:hypothetical protein
MGAPAWTTRVVAGVTAALVIGAGAALALPVITGSGTPTVSVDEVPDTSHAALVKEYEQKVAERKADLEAAKERQATLQKATQEAKAAKEAEDKAAAEAQAEADAKAKAEEEAKAKAKEDAAAKDTTDSSTTKDAKESTDKESKESTETKDKEQSTTPDWWPEHVWAHATSCTVAEDGQTVVGTWDVWIKHGGDWVFVSASDDPGEVSGTDGDKVKIVYADRTATLYKEHDGMAKYRGGPVHVTVANAADSSETHTFKVDLWVVAKDDGTCPA